MEKSPLRSCRKARTFDPYRLPDSVKRSRRRRSATLDEVFLPGQKPTQVCNLNHEPRFEETQHAFGQRLGGWLKRKLGGLFGGDEGSPSPRGHQERRRRSLRSRRRHRRRKLRLGKPL